MLLLRFLDYYCGCYKVIRTDRPETEFLPNSGNGCNRLSQGPIGLGDSLWQKFFYSHHQSVLHQSCYILLGIYYIVQDLFNLLTSTFSLIGSTEKSITSLLISLSDKMSIIIFDTDSICSYGKS